MNDDERLYIENSIRAEFEQTLPARVDRYLSIGHQRIIADHHFSAPSSECINLYRDGYFTACQ